MFNADKCISITTTPELQGGDWRSCIWSTVACCWRYSDLWSATNRQPASRKQHAEQFNKRPTLCIKDLTRWQIAIARGTLNPVIVFQSCCPVIYSCCSAAVSVLEFLMPYSPSQSRSVMRTWLPECERSCTVCVRERERGTGQAGRGKVREIGMDRWTDGRMSSVRSIRRACSRHKRTGRRLEEIPVTNTTDVGRSLWINRRRIFPNRRLCSLIYRGLLAFQ